MTLRELTVAVRWAADEHGGIDWHVRPAAAARGGADDTVLTDYQVRFVGSYAWMRAGSVDAAATGVGTPAVLRFESLGLGGMALGVLGQSAAVGSDNRSLSATMSAEGVALTTDIGCTLTAVRERIAAARAAEMARYAVHGSLAAVKEATQAAVMW